MRRFNASLCAMYIAALFGAFAALTPNRAIAAIVYDNTTTSTGVINDMLTSATTNSFERGNTVTLAGVERIVQQFQVRMRSAGPGVSTFDKRLRFYMNNGPAGAPGAMFWDSGTSPTLLDSGADITYSFPVPDLAVPDTFTWSLQLTNRTGLATTIGAVEYAPVTIGSAPNGFWQNDGAGNWALLAPNASPFAARITAVVPEPSMLSLAATLALTQVRRRRSTPRRF